MIIEIKGVQFVNKGAELMMRAVLEQIQRRWPLAEIALEPSPRSPYTKRARLGAYQKCSLRWTLTDSRAVDVNRVAYWLPKTLRAFTKVRWGLVTESDIDAVFDVSGFAYGDQWPSVNIHRLAAEVTRYSRMGKPYLLLPQAFGPFTRPRDRRRLQVSLPLATLIVARDCDSFVHVAELFDESPVNLCQYPDFTNLIEGTVPEYFENPKDKVLIIPNSRMLDTRNQRDIWHSKYLPLLSDAIRAVRDVGLTPVVLNHEGVGDAGICRALTSGSSEDVPLIVEEDPLLIKGMIGAARAVISSRFHACVSALSQGVPCLGTSWSHKYERLFEEYSRTEFLLPPTTNRVDLMKILADAIDRAGDPQYVLAIETQKRRANALWLEIEKSMSYIGSPDLTASVAM